MRKKAKPLSVYIDDGVTFDQFVALFLALNGLYHSISGDKLKVEGVTGMSLVTEPESEFELHPGTIFENTKARLEESPLSPYTPREQVYRAVNKYAKPETTQTIIDELDRKYPADKWEKSFPTSGACEVLLNKHLDDLVL